MIKVELEVGNEKQQCQRRSKLEMEMEMRATQDVKPCQDLTLLLPPLTFASHHPSPPSSHIRAALRLLHSLPSTCPPHPPPPPRLFGLLTNRDRLMSSADTDVVSIIREGAREMARRRGNLSDDFALEEAVFCLVMTNAVEVQDKSGRLVGIAVYDYNFSWINHSCSPNASYRFSSSYPNTALVSNESNMLINPGFFNGVQTQGESDVCSSSQLKQGCERDGPSIIVRSIKPINKGEAVTVAYTDLLQPKAMRKSELWSKYQFVCCCKRCTASPPTYVDRTLEEISASCLDLSSRFDHNFDRDEANQKLADYMDEVITEYLSVGDPESCCKKMELVLNRGLICELSETEEGKVLLNLRLHPLHHLALNAYMTLASACKISSSDLLALNPGIDAHNHEAFNMSRTSAGYSLLLAGATDYLFQSESSLIASAAIFWVSAGESLLTLARSSGWNLFVKSGLSASKSSPKKHKCSECSLMDRLEVNNPSQNVDFENLSFKFLDCIANMTRKVWSSLSYSCGHLQTYKDPIDFSWLSKSSNLWDSQARCGSIDEGSYFGSEGTISRSEAQLYTEEVKVSVYQLGFHCLVYGGYLANTCYGEDSHLTSQIRNVLHSE